MGTKDTERSADSQTADPSVLSSGMVDSTSSFRVCMATNLVQFLAPTL
jgi:hypothetical protein